MLTRPEHIASWDLGEIHLGFCAPTVELLKILWKEFILKSVKESFLVSSTTQYFSPFLEILFVLVKIAE